MSLAPFGLQQFVLLKAGPFEARDIAPDTFVALHQAPGIVYAGASARTIWGNERINFAFRKWHDDVHLRTGFDFSFLGECQTCGSQISELLAHYPQAPSYWSRLIRAEIIGQARFFREHGVFPADQIAFTLDYLERN